MRKNNQKEKRTTIGIVMAISFLVVVTASGFFYANRAYAKETLQGIKKVVEESQKKDNYGEYENPFVILEVIPDFVQRTFTVKDINDNDVSVGLNIDIGSIGYYVKGEEPSTVNLKNALEAKAPANNGSNDPQNGAQGSTEGDYILKDATARKNMAGIILDTNTIKEEGKTADRGFGFLVTEREMPAGAVEGVFYREFEESKDSRENYREVRLGEVLGDGYTHRYNSGEEETYKEVTADMMKKLQEDKTFIALPRDYPGEYGERFVDSAKGIMTRVSESASDTAKGNFTMMYEPKLVEKEIDGVTEKVVDTDIANKTADPAYWFVTSGKDELEGNPFVKYKKTDENAEEGNKGEFDPYLVLPFTGEEATHRAVFDYIGNAYSGYSVLENWNITNPNDPNQVAPGTPLYTLDETGKVFVFAGYAGEIQPSVGNGMDDEQDDSGKKKSVEDKDDSEKKDDTENTGDGDKDNSKKKDDVENTGDGDQDNSQKKDDTENIGDGNKEDSQKKDDTSNTGDGNKDDSKKDDTSNTGDGNKEDSEKKNDSGDDGNAGKTENAGDLPEGIDVRTLNVSAEPGVESKEAEEESNDTASQPADGAGNKSGNDTAGQPADGAGNESGNDTSGQPTDGAGNESGNDTSGQPTDGAGNESGNDTAGQPGGGAGNESGNDTAGQPTDGTGNESGNDTAGQPTDGTGNESGNDTAGQPTDGTGNESGNDTAGQPADGTGNESGEGTSDQPSGETVTDPADGTGETSESNPEGEKKEEENPDGQKKEDSEKETGYEKDTFTEEGGSGYYVVKFGYIPNNYRGMVLYQVSSYDVDNVHNFKEYKVNTDIDGPIVPNTNGTGVIKLVEANKSVIEDNLIYEYTSGKGIFQWTGEAWLSASDKTNAVKCNIRGAQIYYTTGLINRDFFKRHVLDRTYAECDDLPISVVTKPAADVTVDDINNARMIVLQRGEPYYGCADTMPDEVPGYEFPMYSRIELDYRGRPRDFTDRAITELIAEKAREGFPIISDYGMFPLSETGLNDNETNVYNATRFLIHEGIDGYGGKVNDLGGYNNVVKAVYNVTFSSGLNNGLVNTDFLKEIPKKASDNDPDRQEGFQPVQTSIQNEKVFRMASRQKPLTNEKLSQATIIRYIIAYSFEPEYDQKGSLHILELSPCASYTLQLVTTGDGTKENPSVTTLYKITSTIKDGEHKGEIDNDAREKLIEFKSGDVTLTQMTTAEFVGRVEDINAIYDMIYIGSSIGPYKANGCVVEMYHDSNGRTVFNDENMNGLIYYNIGDTFSSSQMNLYNDVSVATETTRFPGNDISQEKMEALQEFIDAGFPVVVSNDLASCTYQPAGEGEREALRVNTDTVDNCTFLYEFLNDNCKRQNMFLLSEASGSLLNMYLNVGRPKLTLLPGMTSDAVTAAYQLPADSNGNYRAVFEFNVDTVGIGSDDLTYDFELYIDINADGKFSKTNEKISKMQISLEDLAGNPVSMDEQGRYMMKSGESYRATYVLSASQRSVIPWKIRTVQNDNTNLRRADAIGYYEVRDPSGKAEKITVLQILNAAWGVADDMKKAFPDYGENGSEYWLHEREDAVFDKMEELIQDLDVVRDVEEPVLDNDGNPVIENGVPKTKTVTKNDPGHNWNMERTLDDTSTRFNQLMSDRSKVPFEVTIISIPHNFLSTQHNGYLGRKTEKKLKKNIMLKASNNNSSTPEDFLAFFRNFDMLVIGFGDAYGDPNEKILEAVRLYAEEGRSILFTHDNTSLYSQEGKPYGASANFNVHGQKFNMTLRAAFGLDRYNSLNKRTISDNDTFQLETAWMPKSNRETIVEKQDHGAAYPSLLRQIGDMSKQAYMAEMPYPGKPTTPMLDDDGNELKDENGNTIYKTMSKWDYEWGGHWVTTHVESVNKGQITMYPYILDEKFDVAQTHSQYWQLDFTKDEDHDGESDLVVWYTLSGTDVYDMSPRDSRNNYYIFNMGNITYSGVGHSKVMGEDGKGTETENEVKLFINTLIAAYQSGLHDPEIKIIENYNPQSRDVSSFYVSYDEELNGLSDGNVDKGILDRKEDIYFVANSTSLVRTNVQRVHRLSAELYVEVPSAAGAEELAIKGGNAYGKKINIENLYRLGPDGKSEIAVPRDTDGSFTIEGGVVYKAVVPLSELKYSGYDNSVFDNKADTSIPEEGVVARNSRQIMVVATEKISNTFSDGKTTETKTQAMDSIKATRLRVFDMD